MATCLSYLGITFGILALGCAACALGLPYWVLGYNAPIQGDAYAGLWRRCVDQPSGNSCDDFDTFVDKPSLNAVRSMVIIGTFFILVALITGCVSLIVSKLAAQVHLGIVSAAGMVIGGLFIMIGFSVYLEAIFFPLGWAILFDLHAAFILCVFGWLLAWTSAALLLAGTFATKRRKLLNV